MSDGATGPVGHWPDGYRCALSVSVDVDRRYGEVNYRLADDRYLISQTAYDARGTERRLEVLADRQTAATFCWAGRAAVDHPIHVRSAVAAGHEIALHSRDHRPYNRMTPEEQRADMERSLERPQRISGTTPVGHKTASWRYDEATHKMAQELGLLWVMDEPGGDLPYLIQPASHLPPLVQLPPSRWFDDYTLFVDHVLTASHAYEMWRDDLDVLRDEGGMMCLTLHSFVSGRPGPSRSLAWLLDYAIDLGDVWIDRADKFAQWWLGRVGNLPGSD